MANYTTHVTVSGAVGILCAAGAWYAFPSLELGPTGLLALASAAVAGWLGGIVPDLDHDKGLAINEISILLASLVPPLTLSLLWPRAMPLGHWSLLLAIPAHYLLHSVLQKLPKLKTRQGFAGKVRATLGAAILGAGFALASGLDENKAILLWAMMLGVAIMAQAMIGLFKQFTIHRGVFHSIPAAGIYALSVYLFIGTALPGLERLVLSSVALAGFLSHLILDEIWSVDFMGARLKRSFGTALSVWKPKTPATSMAVWSILFVLTLLVVWEDVWRPPLLALLRR